MDEHAFDLAAERTLASLETQLNELGGLDADLESGILTLEFEDGVKFVINSHRAARQIWMAASSRAWHFSWDPESGHWLAGKSGEELFACLAEQLAHKLQRALPHLVS